MRDSRRHMSFVVVALLAIASGTPAFARWQTSEPPRLGGLCTHDGHCPMFSVCSTTLGDCGHDMGVLQICTGICEDPETWHFGARGGFVGVWDGGAKPGWSGS